MIVPCFGSVLLKLSSFDISDINFSAGKEQSSLITWPPEMVWVDQNLDQSKGMCRKSNPWQLKWQYRNIASIWKDVSHPKAVATHCCTSSKFHVSGALSISGRLGQHHQRSIPSGCHLQRMPRKKQKVQDIC